MSSYAPSESARALDSAAAYDDWEADRGTGWVVFAGVLLLMVGSMNCVEGIGAIGNANFFTHNATYVFGDLNTWGWVVLCLGVLQLIVGLAVFVKNQAARWTGVVVLSLNAVAQLLMIPAYPFWSLTFFAVDILAVYGLAVHGKRIGG
jgi:uncharacterized membrane-anchored protein